MSSWPPAVPQTVTNAHLNPQTGMPPIVQSRSKEIIYDALELNPRFIMNPYGPRQLNLSRPQHHW